MTNEIKTILYVDDQWATEEGKDVIIAAWGGLSKRLNNISYKFKFEDAFDGNRYSSEKVSRRIANEQGIDGVILDMDFNDKTHKISGLMPNNGQGFGEIILQNTLAVYVQLPIWIHSSSSDEALKQRCMQKGAQGWFVKKATDYEVANALDKYFLGRVMR